MIQEEPGPPPDGGTRAWLQILAGFLINSITWGYSALFGVYQLHYTTSLSLPKSQISWIGSIQVFLTFFVGTLSGRAADAGYAQHTALLGSVMIVLGTFMTSLATAYWQVFLAQGLCTGLGMGVLFMPAVAVISSYWKRNKALALALAGSGSGVGSVIFPLIVQRLQPTLGFTGAVRCRAISHSHSRSLLTYYSVHDSLPAGQVRLSNGAHSWSRPMYFSLSECS